MEQAKIGIIGGSGLYDMPELMDRSEMAIDTPFGAPSGEIVLGTVRGKRVAFLARHGRGHRVHPRVALELFGDAGLEPAVTRTGEQGTSLVEVLVATALLVTLMAGLMSMAALAISTPAGGSNVIAVRRSGTRPMGRAPASDPTRSAQAPAAFTIAPA